MSDDENLLSEGMRAAFAAVELRAGFAERVTRAWLDEQASAAASRWRPSLPLVVGTLMLAAAGAMFLLVQRQERPSPLVRPPAVTAPAAAPQRPSPPEPAEVKEAKAQYQLGEKFAREKRFKEAIGAYTQVIERAPDKDVVAEAMYACGVAFSELKYCGDAKFYFEKLLERFPHGAHDDDARQRLRELERVRNDKTRCN
jgi:tetratricopeptide (TPR) repeat protein